MTKIAVTVETGSKKTFVSALDWPGWSRGAKSEDLAIESLAEYAQRYAPIADVAGLELPAKIEFDVVERVQGDASTDFGMPGKVSKFDFEPTAPKEAQRIVSLVESSWNFLADVYDATPAELRKGPRGGGRDRDKMYDHVIGAEASYGRQIGVKVKQPAIDDVEAINAMRDELVAALLANKTESKWPMRYAARRIAWHVLDHAWEMQDRSV